MKVYKIKKLLFLCLAFSLCLFILAGCKEENIKEGSSGRDVIDLYGDGYNVNMIVGFDEQGRTVSTVSSQRENRDVGIFYFLWIDSASGLYVNTDILANHGVDTLIRSSSEISPSEQMHWWGEPIYGFYRSSDKWVIRKQMELLTYSGIDFLVFDTTNALTYRETYIKVLSVLHEMNEEGWDAPKVAFYTHSKSIQTINALYQELYQQEIYPDTWYKIDGKPMIIGYIKAEDDMAATGGDYKTKDLSKKLQEFFHIRIARWPADPVIENGFPYTEWTYPQPVNTNMISVSIATHPRPPFSGSLSHDLPNWGRGYNVNTKENVSEDVMKGTFFQSQWETVFREDPELVFVTGWNEWVAWKLPAIFNDNTWMFVDNVNIEYSRDAEPMRGGYEDAFYIQMMMNIRRYKYNSAENYIADCIKKSIDINKDVSQWDEVNAIYRNVNKTNIKRNAFGTTSDIRYKVDAARNNIEYAKVTADKDNIYFLIKCTEDIVIADNPEWMNIFIGLGEAPSMNKGWESYEYAINRSRDGSYAAIEKLNSDGSGKALANAKYTVSGDSMQIEIARKDIKLNKYSSFYFKIADNVIGANEIMNYYTSGISFPEGRLSYLYQIG